MVVILCDVDGRFDHVIIVDWSARSRPAPRQPSRDALWWCRDDEEPRYERTRAAFEQHFMDALFETNRRVLVGFDFSFSYPRWFLDALGVDWRGLWRLLADLVEDAPHHNNRFAVAEELNRRATGEAAPFWGVPQPLPLLGVRKPAPRADRPELRDCEALLRPRPKSAFQLLGAGSVGSQTLLGIPVLERLRRRLGGEVAVWPFEAPRTRIVLAEVYPSCLPRALWSAHPLPDREQVRHLAAALRTGAGFSRQTVTTEGGILLPPATLT